MLKHFWLAIALLAAAPLLAQQAPVDPQGAPLPIEEDRMAIPPQVTGQLYPTEGTLETHPNHLLGGLTFSSAYTDNLLGAIDGYPVSDVSYSIWPTLAVDETTSRLRSLLNYSPGFTFYQRTSVHNGADQNLSLNLQYRLTPHVTASFRDSFQKTSSVFNQPNFVLYEGISGSPASPAVAVIPPVADRLSNAGSGEITYQYATNSMLGAGGSFSNLHYPNPAQVPGLYDSSSSGGSAFDDYRLSKKDYVGAMYQYSRILTYPIGAVSEIQTHAAFLFYTVYLKPTLSLSLSGGPQHADVSEGVLPAARTWSPAAFASLGWQGGRTAFAASYSRIVTGGDGLVGAFHSNAANMSGHWQVARRSSVGVAGAYSIYKTLPVLAANSGGHSITGTASAQHQFGQDLSVEAGYTRLHQNYSGIAVISRAPDTNREYVSISYQFSRPIGR